ncbi:hypothetical protein KUCAC02_027951 [Chaenocephalus aceratus]|uniref:Uncharacterized protein n=1 Tax=Chaenocephalus aceratus TaxID=36190 RepID=A0ACB9X254_CHAAC|nr:hypothetical protein KUCAC02_027951 [Chaenocephalus aceratus]
MSAASSPVSRIRPGWMSSGLKNRGMSPADCSTPLLASFHGNDDEQERRQRRRSRVIDLQTAPDSSFNDSVSHSSSGTPAAVPKLSNAQISEHYSTCIKLSTENKITTKNAFGLHLIDYMADILKQKDSELTNFKVAAGTLDASTKIYAVRVDAVHADAYRVLGGLGAETKPGEDQGSKDDENDGDGEATTKQPRKKRPPKKTVEQNLANINSAESQRKCEVDPMFQRMAASFDESSTAGVFLSVLFCENNRCELLFPSNMTLLQSTPSYSPPRPLTVPASPFMALIERKSLFISVETKHSLVEIQERGGAEAAPEPKNKLQILNEQVDGVKDIMTENVDRIFARGKRLDDLMGKSEDLQNGQGGKEREVGPAPRSGRSAVRSPAVAEMRKSSPLSQHCRTHMTLKQGVLVNDDDDKPQRVRFSICKVL